MIVASATCGTSYVVQGGVCAAATSVEALTAAVGGGIAAGAAGGGPQAAVAGALGNYIAAVGANYTPYQAGYTLSTAAAAGCGASASGTAVALSSSGCPLCKCHPQANDRATEIKKEGE